MRLEYKILWVDDVSDVIEEYSVPIKKFLTNNGFIPSLISCNSAKELEQKIIDDTDYDLIIMDYTFNDSPEGINLIKKIRQNNIYACIILYTANRIDLRTELHNSNVQGVFTLKKQDFVDNNDLPINIIKYFLNKESDINSMRGIVMAEVASFDNKIWDIIKETELCNDEEIIEYVKKAKEHFYTNFCKTVECKEKMLTLLMDYEKSTMHFPSGTRADFLRDVVLKENFPEILPAHSSYTAEVLTPRNKLAHNKTPNFSEEELLQVRKNIIKHKKNLENLYKAIKETTSNIEIKS